LIGLHFHIGSQITINEPFVILCHKINGILDELEAKGIGFQMINVGGGLGIDYDNPDANPIPDFETYFRTFRDNLRLRDGQSLHFELGRAIVAQCGSLISRVLYIKEGVSKKFAIVDAGMTELIRPALYQAHHNFTVLNESIATETYDVVGPVCESSDCFAENETLPRLKRGDLIAIRSAGAYGEVMSSNYNYRHLNQAIFFE
jgi:diaminopimelate decarboxylase